MIQLQVHELDIEEQKDCYSDYLAVSVPAFMFKIYCKTHILSYGSFVDFKSRAINHGLLHWHVITIQNC